MKDKIVTIFGGTGFIGKYVIKELAAKGYTIRVITRSEEHAKNLKTSGAVGQIIPIIADANKIQNISEIISGSYAVVNLIGILFETGKQKFSKLQADLPSRIAEAARDLNVQKLVHISAIVDPESKAKYARTKIAGESAVRETFPEAVIIKPSVVFGAEDNFFNQFAKMAKISPFLPAIGFGKTKFQPVYVGDIAKAVCSAVCGQIKAGTYYAGGPETISFKDILKRIGTYTNRKVIPLPIPFFAAKIIAIPAPSFILTRDQVELLKHDNVAPPRSKSISDVGIELTQIDALVPNYLKVFAK